MSEQTVTCTICKREKEPTKGAVEISFRGLKDNASVKRTICSAECLILFARQLENLGIEIAFENALGTVFSKMGTPSI